MMNTPTNAKLAAKTPAYPCHSTCPTLSSQLTAETAHGCQLAMLCQKTQLPTGPPTFNPHILSIPFISNGPSCNLPAQVIDYKNGNHPFPNCLSPFPFTGYPQFYPTCCLHASDCILAILSSVPHL